MDDDRKMFTAVCLHSLLSVLTPEDLMLYKRHPDAWEKFSEDISRQSVILADKVISTLNESQS